MRGDGGPDGLVGDDLLAGDNATPVRRSGGGYDLTLADVPATGTSVPGATSGSDTLYGSDELELTGDDSDRIFAQSGADTVRAGADEDYVEGGAGDDTIAGGADADVLVGGSSLDGGELGPVDGSDTIEGDGGIEGSVAGDLILGDNATPLQGDDKVWVVQLATEWTDDSYGADTIYGGDLSVTEGDDDDRIFGQAGEDTVRAGSGDDYVEGNQGADDLSGGTGADDLIGGSSSTDGRPLALGRLRESVKDLDGSAAGLTDGVDTINGNAGDDVVLGDNGRITRPSTGQPVGARAPYRDVAMADRTAGPTSGSDVIDGGADDDVLYGQLDDSGAPGDGAGDLINGGVGDDAIIGDLAVVTPTAASALSRPARLVSKSRFIDEAVYPAGSWVPVTSAPATLVVPGGSDVAFGGDGNDTLRLGAGQDYANGGVGDDVLFGGADVDALWGGVGHDRIFGGYGDDVLDLKVRPGDNPLYATVAGVEDTDNRVSTTNGDDLVYGGWGADILQADQGGAGRQPGSDQLVDWVGNHNLYLVCDGPYGAGRVLRSSSPDVQQLLEDLVVAAGGTAVTTKDSGAWLDLGMVTNRDNRYNNQPFPGAPGNFTCEGPG